MGACAAVTTGAGAGATTGAGAAGAGAAVAAGCCAVLVVAEAPVTAASFPHPANAAKAAIAASPQADRRTRGLILERSQHFCSLLGVSPRVAARQQLRSTIGITRLPRCAQPALGLIQRVIDARNNHSVLQPCQTVANRERRRFAPARNVNRGFARMSLIGGRHRISCALHRAHVLLRPETEFHDQNSVDVTVNSWFECLFLTKTLRRVVNPWPFQASALGKTVALRTPVPATGDELEHPSGTCRFGDNPATSVLKRNC
jgi:choline dehydrogenase-like flavoprotein